MTTPRSARGTTPRRDNKVIKGRLDPATYSPMIGARDSKDGGLIMSEGSGIPFNPYLDPFMQMKMMQEKQEKDKEVYATSGDEAKVDDTKRPFNRRYSPIGILIFLFYLSSCIYYFVIRATKTLDMGFTWYGWLVLVVEIITSTATMGYAVLLIRFTRSKRTKGLPLAKAGHEPDEDNLKFHVRVLVPCYKETVDLVEITVKAALAAPLPADARRTVYLCDDGNDPNKAAMIARLGKDCVYVTGRKRDPTGEINGKSNNLNNCLRLIYSEYEPKDIPVSEVIVVFDADMVAKPNFFTKILEVMYDDNVALCLTPQVRGPAGRGGRCCPACHSAASAAGGWPWPPPAACAAGH
jgi:membrane glycosyltransferase